MHTDWDIQPRSANCCRCGGAFADKAPYRTVLTLTKDGYMRRDLCPNCWTLEAGEHAGGIVSTWQGTYKMAAAPPEPIPQNTAESKLRELIASSDPSHDAVRYILAVMLERKKILQHRDTVRHDGRDMLVYEHADTGETFTLADPHLRLDQLEQVQKQVTALLSAGV